MMWAELAIKMSAKVLVPGGLLAIALVAWIQPGNRGSAALIVVASMLLVAAAIGVASGVRHAMRWFRRYRASRKAESVIIVPQVSQTPQTPPLLPSAAMIDITPVAETSVRPRRKAPSKKSSNPPPLMH